MWFAGNENGVKSTGGGSRIVHSLCIVWRAPKPSSRIMSLDHRMAAGAWVEQDLNKEEGGRLRVAAIAAAGVLLEHSRGGEEEGAVLALALDV
jgi:hypothetical protein